MGIEQILLPILGGIAKGTGEGLEQRRRQEMAVRAQQDAITANSLLSGDPALMDTPYAKKFGEGYWGKDGWQAQKRIRKIQYYQNQYDVEHMATSGDPFDRPRMPAGYMPPEAPEPPDTNANRGGIMGLISKFIPGAGSAMNALGISGGGGQGQTPIAPSPSTGLPSGPQGYQPAGGWQTPGAAPQGPMGAPAVTQVGMDQRIGVPVVGRVPTTKMKTNPNGSVAISGIEIPGVAPISGQAAATRKPTRLADNVTVSRSVKGGFTVSVNGKRGESLSDPYKLAEAIINPNGDLDMKDPDVLMRIRKAGDKIAAASSVSKEVAGAAAMAALEGEDWYQLAKQEYAAGQAGATTLAGEQAKLDPGVVTGKVDQIRREEEARGLGKAVIENTPRPELGGLTINQVEVRQQGALAAEKRRQEPLTEGEANRQQMAEGIVDSLSTINKLYKPEYVGAVRGTNFFVDFRKKIGQMKGPEARFWQSIAGAVNARKFLLTGAAASDKELDQLMREMFDPTGTPETFRAELDGFIEDANAVVDRQKRLFGLGRNEALNLGGGPPVVTPTQIPVGGGRTPTRVLGNPVVAPHEATATSAPSPEKKYEVNQSSVATPASRKKLKKQIDQMVKDGLLDPDAEMIVIPDSAAIPGERIQ